MEAVMTREATYEPVAFGGAFVRQLHLLWSSRRPLLLGIGLLGLLGISGEPWTENSMARLLTPWPAWLVLVGPIWALAVWHNEGPAARHYFWAQPVGRRTHTLARVAAGALWLWVLYALLILAALLIGLAEGDAAQLGLISAAGWVNFFTAPLLGYLMVSVLAISSDHPIRWLFGIVFLVPLTLSLIDEWLELEAVAEWLLKPLSHPEWGLGITMIGAFAQAVAEAARVVSDMQTGNDLILISGTWWAATALWLAFWVAVVVLVAGRHPDTLPRLRRSG